MQDPLPIGRGLAIPLRELEFRASRSSGPGGQHANVTASRVEVVLEISSSTALSDEHKRLLRARFGERVTASAQDSRSQLRNRELALERLQSRLEAALRPVRARRPTRPTAAAERRRRAAKEHHSSRKRTRRTRFDESDA